MQIIHAIVVVENIMRNIMRVVAAMAFAQIKESSFVQNAVYIKKSYNVFYAPTV